MSYRIHEHEHKHVEERKVTKLSTPSKVHLDNGDIARMAYPCAYYQPTKHFHGCKHRHLVCLYWVNRFQSCMWYKNMSWHPTDCNHCHSHINKEKLIPIHLRKEFPDTEYLKAEVHFEKDNDGNPLLPGLSATATIGKEPKDNIIHVKFNAQCPSAETEIQETKYSLVLKYDKPYDIMRTVVLKGTVIVHPTIL